jgi:SPP1 gp7 family putative phage head morphogenesis protein
MPATATLNPGLTRTYEVDLVPAESYWRTPTVQEARLDFARIEQADGAAIHGSRLRLGLLLHAQQEAVIRFTRSDRFRAGTARVLPPFMRDSISREWIRIDGRAYYDGLMQYRESVPRTKAPDLSDTGSMRLRDDAILRGRMFADKVLSTIRKIVTDAFLPDGSRVKPQEQLEAEIRTAYAKWIEPAPKVKQPEFHMGLLEIGWEAWQQRMSPVTAFLDTLFRVTKEGPGAVQLTLNATRSEVATERGRVLNSAVYSQGLKDELVEAYQFSAIRDSRTCAQCLSLDKVIRPKNDYSFWGFYTPPLHSSCRCDLIPVLISDHAKMTDPEERDSVLEKIGGKVPPGFGGYIPGLGPGAN